MSWKHFLKCCLVVEEEEEEGQPTKQNSFKPESSFFKKFKNLYSKREYGKFIFPYGETENDNSSVMQELIQDDNGNNREKDYDSYDSRINSILEQEYKNKRGIGVGGGEEEEEEEEEVNNNYSAEIKLKLVGNLLCSNNRCNKTRDHVTTLIYNFNSSIMNATEMFSGYIKYDCDICNNTSAYFKVLKIENIDQ